MTKLLLLLILLASALRMELALAVSATFTLSSPSRTSAGVYDSGGVLVRSLWNNVRYDAGTHTATWNGIDDNGILRPNGSYEFRVLSSNVEYTWEGVVGNTSDHFTGPTLHHPLDTILGMAIAGDTIYFATGYNEGNTASFKTSTTNPQQRSMILDRGASAYHVATDGTNVYWSATDPWIAENSFVYVTTTSTDTEASLSGAVPLQMTHGRLFTSAINIASGTGTSITGLVVQKSGPYLFVSRRAMNRLDVLSKTTGALVHSLTFATPTALTVDGSDDLWMVTNGGTTIGKYTVAADGTLSPVATIPTSGSTQAIALSVSHDGAILMAAHAGTSQQIKGYDNSSGALLWTLGQPEGYAMSPDVADDKFFFRNTSGSGLPNPNWTFIASQPDGKFWVGDTGNYRSQRFDASRAFVDRIQYMPLHYSARVDQNDRTRVFANFLEFRIDYSKPLAPNNGSWTLVRNWGSGITQDFSDAFAILRSVATLSNGRTYAMLRNFTTQKLAVVELPPTGNRRFTGFETPELNYSMHKDGSLRTVNVWSQNTPLVWKKHDLIGFDANHNPQWGPVTMVVSSPPVTPDDVTISANLWSLRPWEVTSSGVVLAFEEYNTPGWHLQGLDLATGQWKWKVAPSTSPNYVGPWPTDGAFDTGNNGFSPYAGGGQHAVGRNIFWEYHGEGWKNGQTNIWTHVYDDGLVVGQFGAVSPQQPRNLPEGYPGMAGNAHASEAVAAPDGSIYLYHNDESWHGGVHRWHVTGLDTIHEDSIPITLANTLQAGLQGTYYDDTSINNVRTGTVRIDPEIAFNWDTSAPSGTSIGGPETWSVKWQGFIKPRYSEVYTFRLLANDGVRLWVNSDLIVDQWKDAEGATFHDVSGTISLDADKLYPIRLEYYQRYDNSEVHLFWSSASQTSEIVPSYRLFFVDTSTPASGTDLHEGLSHTSSVEDGLYGWHRAPGSDVLNGVFSDYWRVVTSGYSYRRDLPADVLVNFWQVGPNSVRRDLLAPDAGAKTEWTLSGAVAFMGEPNRQEMEEGNGTGTYLDILDDSDRVIARLNPRTVSWPDNVQLRANGQPLVQVDIGSWTLHYAQQAAPFRVSANGSGQITFTYGTLPPITTSVFDPASDWRRPRSLRMQFWNSNVMYGQGIDVDGLVFSSSP